MKHVGEHLTAQEARELADALGEYIDELLDEIHEEVKEELEDGEVDYETERGLHCLFENLKRAEELCCCLRAELGTEKAV